MEDRETPRMHKYGESKTIRIMMATVRHGTPSSGLSGRWTFVRLSVQHFIFNTYTYSLRHRDFCYALLKNVLSILIQCMGLKIVG